MHLRTPCSNGLWHSGSPVQHHHSTCAFTPPPESYPYGPVWLPCFCSCGSCSSGEASQVAQYCRACVQPYMIPDTTAMPGLHYCTIPKAGYCLQAPNPHIMQLQQQVHHQTNINDCLSTLLQPSSAAALCSAQNTLLAYAINNGRCYLSTRACTEALVSLLCPNQAAAAAARVLAALVKHSSNDVAKDLVQNHPTLPALQPFWCQHVVTQLRRP